MYIKKSALIHILSKYLHRFETGSAIAYHRTEKYNSFSFQRQRYKGLSNLNVDKIIKDSQ